MNSGSGGCSEPNHTTALQPGDRARLHLKERRKKERKRERRKERNKGKREKEIKKERKRKKERNSGAY